MTETEQRLVAETSRDAMSALDEEELLALHSRIRRARSKFVTTEGWNLKLAGVDLEHDLGRLRPGVVILAARPAGDGARRPGPAPEDAPPASATNAKPRQR